MPIHVTAVLTAKPEKRAELLALFASIMPAVRAEKGCRRYDTHTGAGKPNAVLVYEIWEDKAALDAHLASPHMKDFFARAGEMQGEPDDVRLWEAVDVKP